MIGYGKFRYAIKSGQSTSWPVVGVALQKNYISVYLAVTVGETPIVEAYAGKLGELRSGINNFRRARGECGPGRKAFHIVEKPPRQDRFVNPASDRGIARTLRQEFVAASPQAEAG